MAPKNIVVCCDGTWNTPTQTDGGKPSPTNVWKLYEAVDDVAVGAPGATPQLRWYDEGVGAELGRLGRLLNWAGSILIGVFGGKLGIQLKLGAIVEGATGLGVAQNIREAYCWLSQVYRPGDRIYLFGFSRGAFQVRSLSGALFHCGLLKPEYISYAGELFKLYARERKRPRQNDTRPRWQQDEELGRLHAADMFQKPDQFSVHFLGVWDTVAGLGLPMWGWSFELFGIRTKYHDTTLVPIIEHACHAVAMDEERSSFMPVLLKRPEKWNGKFEQRWFRGAHADVGGGYAGWGPSNLALSDIALRWMMERAQSADLRFRDPVIQGQWFEADAPLHSEVASKPAYVLAGTWPRMFPVPDEPGATASPASPLGNWHGSVAERERRIDAWTEREHLARLGASAGWELPEPDPREAGWRDLEAGEESEPIAVYADRIWNPTGIVLRAGVPYEFRAEGRWLDLKDASDAEGVSSWAILKTLNVFSPRLWLCWAKRVFDAPWMQLVGMVNHPTDWERRTLPAWFLLWYLLVREPAELEERQFPIGKTSAFIPKKSGPLYCFANDMWTTYGNNSGSVTLWIKRLESGSARPPRSNDRVLSRIMLPLGALASVVLTLLIALLALFLTGWALCWLYELVGGDCRPLVQSIRELLPFLPGGKT